MADDDIMDNTNDLARIILKKIALFLFIYILGLYGFSVTLLLVALVTYVISMAYDESPIHRPQSEEASAAPDDKPNWINVLIKELWPQIHQVAKKVAIDDLEPILRSRLDKMNIKGFRFKYINIGQKPPKVSNIRVIEKDSEILIDLDFLLSSNCTIRFEVMGTSIKVRDFQMKGQVRVVLKPLVSDFPIVGGAQIYFLDQPDLDLTFDNAALNIPGVTSQVKKCVKMVIANNWVFPNKMVLPLSPKVLRKELYMTNTAGVLHVHVIRAENVPKSDLLGKGKSDPYAQISVGPNSEDTTVVKNSTDPEWNFVGNFPVENLEEERVQIKVFDEDDMSKDDLLGTVSVAASVLATGDHRGQDSVWLNLQDAESGRLLANMSWMPVSQGITDGPTLQNMPSYVLDFFIDSLKFEQPSIKDLALIMEVAVGQGQRHTTNTLIARALDQELSIEQGMVLLIPNSISSCQVELKITNLKTRQVMDMLQIPVSDFSDDDLDDSMVLSTELGSLKIFAKLKPLKTHLCEECEKMGAKLSSRDTIEEPVESEDFPPADTTVLKVCVEKAVNLKVADTKLFGSGSSDPFVVISCGSEEFRTPIRENTVNPVWNFEGELSIPSGDPNQLLIEVYDHDVMDKNDPLGYVTVDLDSIPVNRGLKRYQLELKNVSTGVIFFTAEVVSSEPELPGYEFSMEPIQVQAIHPNLLCHSFEPIIEFGDEDPEENVTNRNETEITSQVSHESFQDRFNEILQNLEESACKDQLGTLRVVVRRGENLKRPDPGFGVGSGTCDPYAIVRFGKEVFRTDTMFNTTCPMWDYQAEFSIFEGDSHMLRIEVYDQDDYNHDDPIGNGSVDLSSIVDSGGSREVELLLQNIESGTVFLTAQVILATSLDYETRPCDMAASITDSEFSRSSFDLISTSSVLEDSTLVTRGVIKLTLKYDIDKEVLSITVHEARNLPGGHRANPPDPYVKMFLYPDKSKTSKRRTDAKKDTVHPVYEETFTYDNLSIQDVINKEVEVLVLDKKGIFAKNFTLGRALISLSDAASHSLAGKTQWYQLRPHEI